MKPGCHSHFPIGKNTAVHRDASGRLLLGCRSATNEYFSVGLGGRGHAYTISHFVPSRGRHSIALAADQENLEPDYPYGVSVCVRGQNAMFEVDGVCVLEQLLERLLAYRQLGLFTWGGGPVKFTNPAVTKERRTVFVVMQFSAP